ILTVNELLVGLGSVPSNVTEPVLRMLPVAFTMKLIFTVKLLAAPRLAAVQVTVPPRDPTAGPVHVPRVVVAELNSRLLGRTSVKTTFGATTPLLLITQLMELAAFTGVLPCAAFPVT